MISPHLFNLLNLGVVLRGGEKALSVLDCVKVEARSSFFYIKDHYTELLVSKKQTGFSKRVLRTQTVVGNAAGFENYWIP